MLKLFSKRKKEKKIEMEENNNSLPPPPPPIGEMKISSSKPIQERKSKSNQKIFKKLEEPNDLSNYLKIVHVSDTHGSNYSSNIPSDVDILIFSGDFSNSREWYDTTSSPKKRILSPNVSHFNNFLGEVNAKLKFVIGGNHDHLDWFSYEDIQQKLLPNCIYLQESEFIIHTKKMFPKKNVGKNSQQIKVFGSPFTNHRMAFGSRNLKQKWQQIPDDTKILITHVPPFNIMDLAWVKKGRSINHVCDHCGNIHPHYDHWGCPFLKKKIFSHSSSIKLHCFGHVHDVRGIQFKEKKKIINNNNNHTSTEMITFMNGSGQLHNQFKLPLVYYYKLD